MTQHRIALLTRGVRQWTTLWPEAIWVMLLALAVASLFYTSPRDGEFWWSDAPRHAMDGAFYMDLFRSQPVGSLRQYTIDYYLQYPALTILFYPPVFPLAEALFFALFGVSHWVAVLTIAAFNFTAAFGAYRLCRLWLPPAWAGATALLFFGLPEVALWGRQVMLETPAFAFLFWSSYLLFRYIESERAYLLYGAMLVLVCGIYTKQTVVFILPVFAAVLLVAKGSAVLRLPALWVSTVLFGLGVLPWAFITLRFGHVNFNSIAGGAWTEHPVLSWESWLFYLRQLPAQLGWPVLLLAAAGLVLALARKRWREPAFQFFGLWFAAGYIFFSLIALKEPRHTILLLFPAAFFALQGLRLLPVVKLPGVVAAAVAMLLFGHTLASSEVPRVKGYREAALWVARNAPANSVVLFSGYRDGSFIFNLRSQTGRSDLTVLRSDKLFLRVTQRRELGVEELGVTPEQIRDTLNRYGVRYIVNQPNFWDDLKTMQELQGVLRGPEFRQMATIPVSANVSHADRQLQIIENLTASKSTKQQIQMELPIIGAHVKGTIGR